MMRVKFRCAAVSLVTLAALLTGCAENANVPAGDATQPAIPATVTSGHVRVNGESYAPPSGWSVRCNFSTDEPWLLASSPQKSEQYPSLTAGHGGPGKRTLLLLIEENQAWYGDETQATKIELDEDGLRVSGKVVSGTDYAVTATIDIELPCGTLSE